MSYHAAVNEGVRELKRKAYCKNDFWEVKTGRFFLILFTHSDNIYTFFKDLDIITIIIVVKLRINHECSCFIEFINQVKGSLYRFFATSIINSIVQEHEC